MALLAFSPERNACEVSARTTSVIAVAMSTSTRLNPASSRVMNESPGQPLRVRGDQGRQLVLARLARRCVADGHPDLTQRVRRTRGARVRDFNLARVVLQPYAAIVRRPERFV